MSEPQQKLTKNQVLVMQVLEKEGGPLSAYAILDALKGDGLRAPLQVYRATDKLMQLGLIHRLESLNAFVACSHPECKKDDMSAFMICESCGKVEEVASGDLFRQLSTTAARTDFALKAANVELRGQCAKCG